MANVLHSPALTIQYPHSLAVSRHAPFSQQTQDVTDDELDPLKGTNVRSAHNRSLVRLAGGHLQRERVGVYEWKGGWLRAPIEQWDESEGWNGKRWMVPVSGKTTAARVQEMPLPSTNTPPRTSPTTSRQRVCPHHLLSSDH